MRKSNANKVGEITNYEEALAAVRKDGRTLQYVPEELRTAEFCLEAVKQDGRVLGFVPDKLMIEELCLEALMECGKAPLYGPEELRKKVRRGLAALLNDRESGADCHKSPY